MPRALAVPRLLAVAGLLALSACSDASDPSGAPSHVAAPQAVVVEGGNDHFFFLEPIGGPAANGDFNPALSPGVEVCRTDPQALGLPGADACVATVARFGAGQPDGPIAIRGQSYGTQWNFGFGELADGIYRVLVRAGTSPGSRLLGYADVGIGRTLPAYDPANDPVFRPAAGSRTLPIRFRIEYGALCEFGVDCFEGMVDENGGVFVTPSEHGGAQFPIDAVQGPHTLVIEQVPAGAVPYCLPTHHPQFEGCYRFTIEPNVTFAEEVLVGVCLDPAAIPFETQLELQKWDEVDPATLVSIPRRIVDFLECADFQVTAMADASMGWLASASRAASSLLRPFVRAFGPTPLLAGTRSPFGGGLNDFSRLGWVQPLELEVVAGDGQEACESTTLPQDPTLRVRAILGDGTVPAEVAGVPLHFTPSAGGVADPASAFTNAFGLASTSWTLGAAGANTLDVDGSTPSDVWPNWPGVWGSVQLSAMALTDAGLEAAFLLPIVHQDEGEADFVSGLSPVLRLCQTDAAGDCVPGSETTSAPFVEETRYRRYRGSWSTPATLDPGRLYRLDVVVGGQVIGSHTLAPQGASAPPAGAFIITAGTTYQQLITVGAGDC